MVCRPQGKLIESRQLHSTDNTIDISAFSRGVYIFKLITQDKVYQSKIIKK